MTRPYLTKDEYRGGFPIFLIEIVWGGVTYRMATNACLLSSDDGDLSYTDGLRDFDFVESADLLAYNPESNLVSCSVEFTDVNLLQEWSRGNVLEGSKATFSYVVFKDGSIQQSYENRVLLFVGTVQEPQFGDPNESDSFCALSIIQEPIDQSALLLDPALKIDSRFPNQDTDTADGKIYPLILGVPGHTITAGGATRSIFSTPAYVVQKFSSSASLDCRFLIAGHRVKATQVTIQDDNQGITTKTVQHATDSNNNLYAFIEVNNTSGLSVPGSTISGVSREWWVRWAPSTGGGLVNVYQDGVLEGGGDICRWALSKTGQSIDDGAWANVSAILNKYTFAGYVNDPEVLAWDWLQGNILPYLPVTVRSGPYGLRPVLNQMYAVQNVRPVASIKIGETEEFYLESAVETIRATADLYNDYTLQYAKGGFDQDYTQSVRCTNTQILDNDIPSQYSQVSKNRFGDLQSSSSTDYIYDLDTAKTVAMQAVRANSLPLRSIQVSGSFHYGFFQIGDIIDVSSTRLYITNQKMIIAEKSWAGDRWVFKCIFEDNPIQNQRSV